MNNVLSLTLKPLLALSAILFLSACETVEGAGEDISNAGDVISETARDAQDDQ